MRRFLWIPAILTLLVCSSFIALVSTSSDRQNQVKLAGATGAKAQGVHSISVTPWGPDQTTIDETKSKLLRNPTLQRYLDGRNYRFLSFDFVESAVKQMPPEPPSRYRATFFNYASNRSVVATGSFIEDAVTVSLPPEQPTPSPEEFEAAVKILMKDPELGDAIRDGSLQPYPPMPPLLDIDQPVNKVERTLTVGLLPKDSSRKNEIVGVNMIRETVSRYDGGAPQTSYAVESNCGVTSAGQATTSNGTAGQFEVVISRGTEEIWRFICIRPSASSGNNRSGIELQNVRYRTKLVLARANAPILNVQYYRNACGPFRDWSWQEGMFVANGTDVPDTNGGVRLCTDEPETVLDNGTDSGNYRGVAIYDREEVTLVSELNAGWYRYITKWIFHDDGMISPRFGFGATINSCVCNGHIHHVYWRFDFDVATAANNAVEEFNQGIPKSIDTESMCPRLSPDQFWRVFNTMTGEAVLIKPGPLDGNYDKFGQGDLWMLRNHFPAEIDDSGQPSGSCSTCAHLNPMLTNESIAGQDVVVWYGGHWAHDHFDQHPMHGDGPHVNGPDLILQKY
ncbi:MAG TPA: hypothetical protein VKN18_14655 [Blastocatellia bacterium]|nr:hypothetical protein [Blastocatellia bacterium]